VRAFAGHVVVIGGGALAEAWQWALAQADVPSQCITSDQSENALLTGLRQIAISSRK